MTKINQQDDIKIIEDSVEMVRTLPDVYIGALGDHGFKNMYREILQNSLDEIIKGNTLDKNITVSFDEKTKACIIEDNGQGIQLDMLVKVFSILASSSNYNKAEGSGRYSSGKNGMGGTITNFLSEFFIVESYRMDGTAAMAEFKEGVLSKQKTIKCPKGKHGLFVTFAPSKMMGEINVTVQEIYELTWKLAHLCSIGTCIVFNAIDFMGQKKRSVIKNEHGIYDLLQITCKRGLVEPIYYTEDNGTMKIEVLLTYDIEGMDDSRVLGFANMCPADSGTHIEGFLDGVAKYFRDYMNKIYLANNKKLSVNLGDIRTGLCAVVSVFHIKPLFTGQSKETFSNEEMKPYMRDIMVNALNAWSKTNPNDLQKICKYLKEVCEIRYKSDNEKVKITDKYTTSVVTGLPEKYERPLGKKNIEVIITEGDSAKGGLVNNRDKQTQGIMPIRGKINNAFTTPTKKYFENEEVAGLFKIFGYSGYSKKFDPAKFKPEKVIIAADADPDGSHIASLLFGMFLRYLPFVIEQGKLYMATPPLYGIKEKGKNIYFTDMVDYIQYVQSTFCKSNEIVNVKTKKAYTKKEITQILYKNIDYVKYIDKVANTYAIDPYFLEFILFNYKKEFKAFKTQVEKAYRFVKVGTENNCIIIRGLVGSTYQTVFLNNRLLNDCSEILKLIDRSEEYYIINGSKTKSSLYNLMILFRSFEPKNIVRYKGLGEMDGEDLGESTIIPGKGRTLKQYTIKDVKAELKYITELQSDKTAFIKNVKIRKEDIV